MTYRKIESTYWTGATGRALRRAGVDAQLLGVYLLSCRHANMLGLYVLPLLFAGHELGWPEARVSKAMKALEAAGFARYDAESEMVFVPEMAHYQVLEGHERLKPGDLRLKSVRRAFLEVPLNPFIDAFRDRYAGAFGLPEHPSCGASKPLQSPFKAPCQGVRGGSCQEQEQEQQQDTDAAGAAPVVAAFGPSDLLTLWNEAADRSGWRAAKALTAKRRTAALARLREHPTREAWLGALERAGRSAFLLGRLKRSNGHEGWRPDIDWLLKPNTFINISEGKYDGAPVMAMAGPAVRDAEGNLIS